MPKYKAGMHDGKQITEHSMDEGHPSMSRKRLIWHLILPSIAPAALIWLYFTPKDVFGCANRGFMALAVVFLASVAAIGTAFKGLSEKRRGESEAANWWIIATLILLSPLVLLVGPLG
jgi:hypothetical protein